jgi:hypothetical protein
MGTFNYAHQLADQITHYNLDVWPYFTWNNNKESMDFFKENKNKDWESVAIDKNEDAMKRYKEYEELVNGY